MSRAEETFTKFESIANQWILALENYTPEQFLRKPSEDEWSIGQVYVHLTQGTNFFHIRNVEECLAGNGTRSDEGKNQNGDGLFAAGGFPPIQIKVPASPEYTPRQPESIEQMRQEMMEVVERMRSLASRITGCDPAIKAPHPGLGLLNADEWYRLVEMHFRHHLHQKERLDRWLATEEAVAG